MLDFCGEYGITADVEVVAAGYVNQTHNRVVACDVAFRFVIDTATIELDHQSRVTATL